MQNGATDEQALAERLGSAEAMVLVDVSGKIVWMNREARQRVNGELNTLELPLAKPESDAIDCFVTPVEMTIRGRRVTLGVIQEVEVQKTIPDLMASIESVLADSTSWFTRTVLEKLKTLGSAATSPNANRPDAGDVHVLSGREREVLGLICEGRSDAQMGKILGLSENTVRNHIASLYRKIGVNRRTAAVIWARERGISGCIGLGLDPPGRRRADRALPY
jgi:DNA-binding CsgD family transcriptional regulator